MDSLPADFFISSEQFTPSIHRDVYPSIDPTIPSLSQSGKVIAITGAARGLGRRAFAQSFAKANPKGIVLIGRSKTELEATEKEVHEINPEIQVLKAQSDMLHEHGIKGVWRLVKETFGHADVLINNAALTKDGTIREGSTEDWWVQQEANVRGTYLHTHHFLALLPESAPATVVSLVSTLAFNINPGYSSHSMTKLAILQLTSFIAAENPNVTALAVHPGIVDTDALLDSFRKFSGDTPALVGGVAVWIASQGQSGAWLSGRFISSNWDVEQLKERKPEIEKDGLLKMALNAKLGKAQFE